ncbi:MAG: hypothetical protein KAW47_05870 [Thermoplasmatales archaeon]|nr:hypothetical protein [Thermoplasmatales archaeon]
MLILKTEGHCHHYQLLKEDKNMTSQTSSPWPWGFKSYAKETLTQYKQQSPQERNLIRFYIKEEITNYQNLLNTFDEIENDERNLN